MFVFQCPQQLFRGSCTKIVVLLRILTVLCIHTFNSCIILCIRTLSACGARCHALCNDPFPLPTSSSLTSKGSPASTGSLPHRGLEILPAVSQEPARMYICIAPHSRCGGHPKHRPKDRSTNRRWAVELLVRPHQHHKSHTSTTKATPAPQKPHQQHQQPHHTPKPQGGHRGRSCERSCASVGMSCFDWVFPEKPHTLSRLVTGLMWPIAVCNAKTSHTQTSRGVKCTRGGFQVV